MEFLYGVTALLYGGRGGGGVAGVRVGVSRAAPITHQVRVASAAAAASLAFTSLPLFCLRSACLSSNRCGDLVQVKVIPAVPLASREHELQHVCQKSPEKQIDMCELQSLQRQVEETREVMAVIK